MKILVTGSSGLVGGQVCGDLEAAGREVVRFDIGLGQDLLNTEQLGAAAEGCDGIVHCAALLEDRGAEEIIMVNVQGTWNVLSAAIEADVGRVVSLSSVNAMGMFLGLGKPDYLPIDEAHPCRPSGTYGISKRMGEALCRTVAEDSAVSVICLRPPAVWTPETYGVMEAERAARPESEWQPFWEYGAFLDVRDLSDACSKALTCDVDRFACLLVNADDITTSGKTSRELAAALCPDAEWRGGGAYDSDPYKALVDTARARAMLGWTPQYTWRDQIN